MVVTIYDDASHGTDLLLTYTRTPLMCRELTICHLSNTPCNTPVRLYWFSTFMDEESEAQKDNRLAQSQYTHSSSVLEPIFLLQFSTVTLTPDLFLLYPVTLSLKILQTPLAFTLCHGLCPAQFLL